MCYTPCNLVITMLLLFSGTIATQTNKTTIEPTLEPTFNPTAYPTIEPTFDITSNPTIEPTMQPSNDPSLLPTSYPTNYPSDSPSNSPTAPTQFPSVSPSLSPTLTTINPTEIPTLIPTSAPTLSPIPTESPTPLVTYCGTQRQCYYVNITSLQGTTKSIDIYIIDGFVGNFESYYDIYITPTIYGCVNPRISFRYERIDNDLTETDEYIVVQYSNVIQYYLFMVYCGGMSNQCGLFDYCLTTRYFGEDQINVNQQIMFEITRQARIQPFCSSNNINAVFTFHCDPIPTPKPTPLPTSITLSPTPSPTLQPTASPTNIPTQPPSDAPTIHPTLTPSTSPTFDTNLPTYIPSHSPTEITLDPSTSPTAMTSSPSLSPTSSPLPIYNEICVSGSAHSNNYNGIYKYSNWSFIEQGALYKLHDVSVDVYLFPWIYSGYYYYLIGPDPNTTVVYGYSRIPKPSRYIFDITDYFNANWLYYNGQSFVTDSNLIIKQCNTRNPTAEPTESTLNPTALPTPSPTPSPTSLPTSSPTTSSPTQIPTPSPTPSPTANMISGYGCTSGYLCNFADIYPLPNAISLHPVRIKIIDNAYKDILIYFKVHDNSCYDPKISLEYEQPVLQNSNEWISAFSNDFLASCFGDSRSKRQCDVFSNCLSEQPLDRNEITTTWSYTVRLWVSAEADAHCIDYHPWSINLVLTLICGLSVAPTASPTDNPTRIPTMSPSLSPTWIPTDNPTPSPTLSPTSIPTPSPTRYPSPAPTPSPTRIPTHSPTVLASIVFINNHPDIVWVILTGSLVIIVIGIICNQYRKYKNAYIMKKVLVLIIGITKFDDKKLNLPNDVNNIAKLIKLWQNTYHYDVRLCNYYKSPFYCTKRDVVDFIDEHLEGLTAYDGVIVHIFTHGQNGDTFISSDGKTIELAFIKHELNESSQNMCMKIIFYHSCRGNVTYHSGQNMDELSKLYNKNKCCCCCIKTKTLKESKKKNNIEMTRITIKNRTISTRKNRAGLFHNNNNNGKASDIPSEANCVVLFGNIDDRATSSKGYFTHCIYESFAKNAEKLKKKDFVELIIGFNGLCRNLAKLSKDAEICTTEGIGTMAFGKKVRFEIGKNKSDQHKIVIEIDTTSIVKETSSLKENGGKKNGDNLEMKLDDSTNHEEEMKGNVLEINNKEDIESNNMDRDEKEEEDEEDDSVITDNLSFIYNDEDYHHFIDEYIGK